MKPLAPISDQAFDADQARRAAARQSLHFHIDTWGTLHAHDGEGTKREATEQEIQMWDRLFGFGGIVCTIRVGQALDAHPLEFVSSLTGEGPYYLSSDDLAVLRRDKAFGPNTDRESLIRGFFGSYKEKAHIYVSRAIPKGYYLNVGRIVPELNWHPTTAVTRELAPELDEALRVELELNLRPLLIH